MSNGLLVGLVVVFLGVWLLVVVTVLAIVISRIGRATRGRSRPGQVDWTHGSGATTGTAYPPDGSSDGGADRGGGSGGGGWGGWFGGSDGGSSGSDGGGGGSDGGGGGGGGGD